MVYRTALSLFAVEPCFFCFITESGYAEDISAIEIRLIDWLIANLFWRLQLLPFLVIFGSV